MPGKQIVIKHAPKQLAAVKLAEGSVSENEMVENHEASKQGAHADVYVAIRDAFDAAGRKLQDYVRRQRELSKSTSEQHMSRSRDCLSRRQRQSLNE